MVASSVSCLSHSLPGSQAVVFGLDMKVTRLVELHFMGVICWKPERFTNESKRKRSFPSSMKEEEEKK